MLCYSPLTPLLSSFNPFLGLPQVLQKLVLWRPSMSCPSRGHLVHLKSTSQSLLVSGEQLCRPGYAPSTLLPARPPTEVSTFLKVGSFLSLIFHTRPDNFLLATKSLLKHA